MLHVVEGSSVVTRPMGCTLREMKAIDRFAADDAAAAMVLARDATVCTLLARAARTERGKSADAG
jgi:hypothetical protein